MLLHKIDFLLLTRNAHIQNGYYLAHNAKLDGLLANFAAWPLRAKSGSDCGKRRAAETNVGMERFGRCHERSGFFSAARCCPRPREVVAKLLDP